MRLFPATYISTKRSEQRSFIALNCSINNSFNSLSVRGVVYFRSGDTPVSLVTGHGKSIFNIRTAASVSKQLGTQNTAKSSISVDP